MNEKSYNGNHSHFITTAIPYVNADPHIGHALEYVLTDALARYQRFAGKDTRFLTGTDENSLKNVRAAEQANISTRALVDQNAAKFYALQGPLSLSFDDFIRTSADQRHEAGVRKLWQACDHQGDIYKQLYRGLYCVGCEQFYPEAELVDGLCPEHRTKPEIIEEKNYFFRLSRYEARLYHLIESDQLRIVPETRKNEVLSFIKAGLLDFSISRSQTRAHGWGIPVPDDPDQVIYVWFDALSNYITALNYATEGTLYHRYWLNNQERVHVIGKGITRFHAIYWPAILLSAGVPLPTTLFIHGYVTLNGEKVSKTLGNVIDPVALATEYGPDALRYYLLREIKAAEDGDFTFERFLGSYNADLADQLGNLLSRVLGLVNRYYDGIVPQPAAPTGADHDLISLAGTLPDRIETAIDQFAPHKALDTIWALIGAANKYVVQVRPWEQAKQRQSSQAAEQRLATTLYNLVEVLRIVALFCTPFLPTTADTIRDQLGVSIQENGNPNKRSAWGGYPAGTRVQSAQILFPKQSSRAEKFPSSDGEKQVTAV